ncbi:hypothetical protein I6F35_28895 [Bradyrhizobium sp. BRP22]|nr:hypothetical protein [Bradyrhizobium sp. BRP22]
MYDAMHAVFHGGVPEIPRDASVGSDEDDAIPKELFLRRAAVRISWLLVFALRNFSASATPLDLTYSAGRVAISRLITEGDCWTSEGNPKFKCDTRDFASSNNATRGSSSDNN